MAFTVLTLRHDEKDNYHVDASRTISSALAPGNLEFRASPMPCDSTSPNFSEGPTGDVVNSEITRACFLPTRAVSGNGDRFYFLFHQSAEVPTKT